VGAFKVNIEIIGSGSQGNSILFDGSVLIDAGMPYKHIDEYVKGINAILLTHRHSDHLNTTTIRKIHIANEKIKFCCGSFLKDILLKTGLPEKNIIVIDAGNKYKMADIIFSPFNLQHDVPNVGYRLLSNGKKHIHATDTFSLDGITAKDYDSATIECNHHLDAAHLIIEEKTLKGEFSHLKRAISTHLSVHKAIEFIRSNSIGNFMPVHVGSSTANEVYEEIENFISETIEVKK
jgi:L-ascorbate metabolism protein UlaG (beta-lactamase superfamily)